MVSGPASTVLFWSFQEKITFFWWKSWRHNLIYFKGEYLIFSGKNYKQQYLFHFSLVLPKPLESLVSRLSYPLPHHYQLSLNSSDHHLNYLLSCPPDGFFANYNFFVDGQGIMTAEAYAMVAEWNTKRANGCRCVYKIQLLSCAHTDTNTLTKDTKTWENIRGALQPNLDPRTVFRYWCKHTHTHTQTHTPTHIPPPPCRKAIYWPSAEMSSSKVNLRTCLMCSLSPLLRFLSLSLFLGWEKLIYPANPNTQAEWGNVFIPQVILLQAR